MSTLAGRTQTALTVIDAQNQVLAGTYDRDRVVKNIGTLVERARAEGVPVVWVQDSGDNLPRGSTGWELIPELRPDESEPVVHKLYADAFEETDLENVLAAQNIGKLLICGAQTDECIRSTLHGAIVRGYDAILVSDAHTTEDAREWGAPPPEKVIDHTNLYWQSHRAPGREAGIVATESVAFS
ncbi:MAG TPA: isochorismatase family protein [Actinomycetes bacterium]|nr:isochorismatase family protein [Actinomycetes bacterium]